MRFPRMTRWRWMIAVGVLCVFFLAACIAVPGCFERVFATKLMELTTPDRSHRAELLRFDLIDRNYIIHVDGRRVYVSPDFAPRHDLPFRETLLWDRTGRVVLLEVATHRIFGYDASAGRRLTTGELLAVELPPEPPLWEYYFESEWPGMGWARQPTEDTRQSQGRPDPSP